MSVPSILLVLRRLRPDIMRIAAKYGIFHIQVYGEVAGNEALPGANVGLLVQMEPGRGAFDLVGFAQEVQSLSGFVVAAATELPEVGVAHDVLDL